MTEIIWHLQQSPLNLNWDPNQAQIVSEVCARDTANLSLVGL